MSYYSRDKVEEFRRAGRDEVGWKVAYSCGCKRTDGPFVAHPTCFRERLDYDRRARMVAYHAVAGFPGATDAQLEELFGILCSKTGEGDGALKKLSKRLKACYSNMGAGPTQLDWSPVKPPSLRHYWKDVEGGSGRGYPGGTECVCANSTHSVHGVPMPGCGRIVQKWLPLAYRIRAVNKDGARLQDGLAPDLTLIGPMPSFDSTVAACPVKSIATSLYKAFRG